jgi:5,10-methylenetetrahydrofolate reductase
VSRATTKTVVISSLSVLGLDFVLTSFVFDLKLWENIDMEKVKLDIWVGILNQTQISNLTFSISIFSHNFKQT